MKTFVVMTVARQIEGEYILVKPEQGFVQASKADELMKKLKSQYVTPEGKQIPITLTTNHGPVNCHCEIGAFEIEVDTN